MGQLSSDTVVCKEVRDINNRVFQQSCYIDNKQVVMFYIDTSGNKLEVCRKPDNEAVLFNSKTDFFKYIEENLNWYTQNTVEGKIYLALYISEKGKISEYRIIKEIDVCPECTISAKELMSKILPIRPAYKDDMPVKSIQIISIPFK